LVPRLFQVHTGTMVRRPRVARCAACHRSQPA